MKPSRLRSWLLPLLAAVGAGVLVGWWLARGPQPYWTVETDSVPTLCGYDGVGFWIAPSEKSQATREGFFDLKAAEPRSMPEANRIPDGTPHWRRSIFWVRVQSSRLGSTFHAFDRISRAPLFTRTVRECHSFQVEDLLLVSWVEQWLMPGLRLQVWNPRTSQCVMDVFLPYAARRIVERSLTLSPNGRWVAVQICHVKFDGETSFSLHVFDLQQARQVISWKEEEASDLLWAEGAEELVTVSLTRIATAIAKRWSMPDGKLIAERDFAVATGGMQPNGYRVPKAFNSQQREWLLSHRHLSLPRFTWVPDLVRSRLPPAWVDPQDRTSLIALNEETKQERVSVPEYETSHPLSVIWELGVLVEIPSSESTGELCKYALYPLAGSYPWPWPWRFTAIGLAALLAFITLRWLLALKSGGRQPAEGVVSASRIHSGG